jgi:hypothetical protein
MGNAFGTPHTTQYYIRSREKAEAAQKHKNEVEEQAKRDHENLRREYEKAKSEQYVPPEQKAYDAPFSQPGIEEPVTVPIDTDPNSQPTTQYNPKILGTDTCLAENTSTTQTGEMTDTGNILGVNYTGPGVSDGKFQESVEFGTARPLDTLDFYSRMHDTVYKRYHDIWHRRAADKLYHDQAMKLKKAFPWIAGTAVWYGNRLLSGVNPVERPSAHEVARMMNAERDIMRLFDEDPEYRTYVSKYPEAYRKPRQGTIKRENVIRSGRVKSNAVSPISDEVVMQQVRRFKGFSELYAKAKESLTQPKRKWKKKKLNMKRATKVLPHLYS